MQNIFGETGKAMVGLVALGESIVVTLLHSAQLYEDADAAAASQFRPPMAPPQQSATPPPIDFTRPLG
jgi:hypothetical protein